MPETTFTGMIIGRLDELTKIRTLQELLRIALEEVAEPRESTLKRLEVLIASYLSQSGPHLDNLQLGLESILRLVRERD